MMAVVEWWQHRKCRVDGENEYFNWEKGVYLPTGRVVNRKEGGE